jgi:hypothetical protein
LHTSAFGVRYREALDQAYFENGNRGSVSEGSSPPLPFYHSAQEILAEPRFPVARDALIDAMLKIYEHDPNLNRLLQEAGRNVLFVIIMCLNARYDESDRATWPTMQLVTRSAAAQGVSSARRIHDLVMHFVSADYIELRGSSLDRRTRLVTPTEKMIAQDQDWLVSHYLPLQILYPDPGYDLVMRRDPAFQIAQRLVASSFFSMSAELLAHHGDIVRFMIREAGLMTLLKLMQLDRSGALGRGISFADIGARFGASRTQVRKILQEAASVGFLELSTDDRPIIRVTAQLYAAFDRFLAAGMSGHDLIYQLAAGTMAPATLPSAP